MWFERMASTVSGKTAIVCESIFMHLWTHSHTGTPNKPRKEQGKTQTGIEPVTLLLWGNCASYAD